MFRFAMTIRNIVALC